MKLKNRILSAYQSGAVDHIKKKNKQNQTNTQTENKNHHLLKAFSEASLCYVTSIQIQSISALE